MNADFSRFYDIYRIGKKIYGRNGNVAQAGGFGRFRAVFPHRNDFRDGIAMGGHSLNGAVPSVVAATKKTTGTDEDDDGNPLAGAENPVPYFILSHWNRSRRLHQPS